MTGATVGVILAGGLARRMGGGDKCRQVVGGRSILVRTVACVGPQVAALALNANGDAGRFADVGLPVLADPVAGHPGPLAGVLAGLIWAAARGAGWLVSVPGDCPFLPGDLVARLHAARGAAMVAVAASGGRVHPVAGLWPVACRDALAAALAGGERRVGAFVEALAGHHAAGVAEWAVGACDPFLNVNTAEDLAWAELGADRAVGGALLVGDGVHAAAADGVGGCGGGEKVD